MKKMDKFFINGEFVKPHGTEVMDLISPTTREKVAEVVLGDEVDVQNAVNAANEALKTFSQTSKAQRIEYLLKLYKIISRRNNDLVDVMVEEYGCPRTFADMMMKAAADDFKNMATLLETFEFDSKINNFRICLEPVGVVGVIIPWNASNGFIATKISTAIAAGCTSVIKPSEMSARQTSVMMECFQEAGLPAGVVNFVNGTGAVVGAEMTRNPGINKITFTGSTAVGKIIAKGAVDTMKRVTLELGGKSPNIILDDVDFATTIPQALYACLINSGQACIAATRLLVPRKRLEEVNQILKETVKKVKIGRPSDIDTQVGTMVNSTQWNRVQEYIRVGIEDDKATLLTGGLGRPDDLPNDLKNGNFVKVTIFTDVDNSMRIAQEEIFGPVLCVIPYEDDEDAIRIANDTTYGLASYITGKDSARVNKIANQLKSGRVCLNGAFHDPFAPFGGYKNSGYGREYGSYGLAGYLEVKAIIG